MLEVRALAVDGLAELCAAAAAAARVARFCNCRAFIPEERESVNVCMCVFCACKTKGTTCATELLYTSRSLCARVRRVVCRGVSYRRSDSTCEPGYSKGDSRLACLGQGYMQWP